jgi:hypothetical protein
MQRRALGDRPLPRLVTAYVERAVPPELATAHRVRITQEGCMWLKPGASPRRFTATQELTADRVGFAWKARFPIAPLLAMTVLDEFRDGAGRLEVRALGVTLQRQSGRETSIGEAIRYLAELPLVPQAMTGNHELEWRELGARSVAVSTIVAGEPVGVTVEVDRDGDIVRVSSDARPYRVRGAWTATGWVGTFAGYRTLGGLRIPTRAEVAWQLPEGPFTYWRGRIASALALDVHGAPR